MKVFLLLLAVTTSLVAAFIPSAPSGVTANPGWILTSELKRSTTKSAVAGSRSRPFSQYLLLSAGRSTSSSDVALCLKGGGFLAFAVHTGLLTGLLGAANRNRLSSSYDLEESKLFDRVETIVSNSGGTWFSSQLMYSNFVSLVEKMASRDAESAAKLFKDNWSQPWIDATKPKKKRTLPSFTRRFIKTLFSADDRLKDFGIDAIDLDNLEDLLDSLKLLLFFYQSEGGLTWINFVDTLLTTTSDMSKSQTLGSKVNNWCKGKAWVLNISTVTPPSSQSYPMWKKDISSLPGAVAALISSTFLPYAAYNTESTSNSEMRNPLIPSQFSVMLGAASGTPPPLSVAAPGVLEGLKLTYEGKTDWWDFGGTHAVSPRDSICYPSPQEHLSLSGVVACSSAFLGGFAAGRVGARVAAELDGDFTMWLAADEAAVDSFERAEDMVKTMRTNNEVSKAELKRIANAGVHSIIDGGFTDNTGIINAVAAGAKELYAWVDTTGTRDDIPSLEGVLNLFKGGASERKSKFFGDSYFFQIFSMARGDAENQISQFQQLQVDPADDLIVDFRIGTIKTTTVKNSMVGIEAGIDVTLNIFSVASTLTIGFLEDFNNYATLVGQIAGTLENQSNQKVVCDMLACMMDGTSEA